MPEHLKGYMTIGQCEEIGARLAQQELIEELAEEAEEMIDTEDKYEYVDSLRERAAVRAIVGNL